MDSAARAGFPEESRAVAAAFPEVFTRENDNGLDADGNPVDPNYGDVRDRSEGRVVTESRNEAPFRGKDRGTQKLPRPPM